MDRPIGVALDAASNIYVANNGNNSVTVYAGRQQRPRRSDDPSDLALDSSLNVYVGNFAVGKHRFHGSFTVYAAGANGDSPALQDVHGAPTRIYSPRGLAVDSEGDIYVTSFNGRRSHINVYAAGANGKAAPIRTIVGANTRLYDPYGIAIH